MVSWINKLDTFLTFNEYDILTNSGEIKSEFAKQFAEKEYEKFRIDQDVEYKSDFDNVIQNIKNSGLLPKETKITTSNYKQK